MAADQPAGPLPMMMTFSATRLLSSEVAAIRLNGRIIGRLTRASNRPWASDCAHGIRPRDGAHSFATCSEFLRIQLRPNRGLDCAGDLNRFAAFEGPGLRLKLRPAFDR